jgi:flagellar biosynthetic protein FlhB
LRLVAQRIKAIAAENNVPIVEKPVVARDLYKNVKVGQQIPARLFGAVAEILAFLYRLGNEKIRQTVGVSRTVAPTPAPITRKTEIT